MAERAGMIDSWANAFLPDREALWDASLAAQGVPIKVRRDPEDAFCDAGTMIARMDEIGLQTLVLPVCDLPPHAGVTDYEAFATRVEEIEPITIVEPEVVEIQEKPKWTLHVYAGNTPTPHQFEIEEKPIEEATVDSGETNPLADTVRSLLNGG